MFKLGLQTRITESLHLLRLHVPCRESDRVLNIAYNALILDPRRQALAEELKTLRRLERGNHAYL